MWKRRVYHVGFWIFTVLIFCTAVSAQIQRLMRNEVTYLYGEKEEGSILAFPASCLMTDADGNDGIYRVEKIDGVWGEEFTVFFQPVRVVQYGEERIEVLDEGLSDPIADYSAYPLKDGEVVKVTDQRLSKEEALEEALEEVRKQKPDIIIALCSVPAAFLLAYAAKRNMNHIFERNIPKCIIGIVLLAAAALLLWLSIRRLGIPRSCLPPKQIFDIEFYRTLYQHP